MSFTFGMSYKPAYQKRHGNCASCHQGIEAGSRVMIGTGYFGGHFVKKRYHFDCYIKEVEVHAKDWFFKNDYIPTAMAPEKKAELNRLRAKRYYIQHKRKGGEPNEKVVGLEAIEKQIALVKSRDSGTK
jgi:hypothetical protein